MSKQEANIKSNYDLIKKKQGKKAADRYLNGYNVNKKQKHKTPYQRSSQNQFSRNSKNSSKLAKN